MNDRDKAWNEIMKRLGGWHTPEWYFIKGWNAAMKQKGGK